MKYLVYDDAPDFATNRFSTAHKFGCDFTHPVVRQFQPGGCDPLFGECTTGDQRVNGLMPYPIPAEQFKHNAARELTAAQDHSIRLKPPSSMVAGRINRDVEHCLHAVKSDRWRLC